MQLFYNKNPFYNTHDKPGDSNMKMMRDQEKAFEVVMEIMKGPMPKKVSNTKCTPSHSTVTLLAKFLGWSTSQPLITAT